MEKFGDFITNPDWWSVVATIIAAIVAAVITYVLGRRQNELQQQQLKLQEQQNEIQKYQTKLQEQQVKAQEYEIYKRLYLLLSNANGEIDNFIEELDRLLWEPYYNSDKNALSRKKTHIDNLFKDLRNSYIDYELKLSKETFNKDGYLKILNLMSRVLLHTINSLENGEARLSQGVQHINNVDGDMEKGHILHIGAHFKGGYMWGALMQTLEQFTELKKKVRCDNSLLESIRAKCKID